MELKKVELEKRQNLKRLLSSDFNGSKIIVKATYIEIDIYPKKNTKLS